MAGGDHHKDRAPRPGALELGRARARSRTRARVFARRRRTRILQGEAPAVKVGLAYLCCLSAPSSRLLSGTQACACADAGARCPRAARNSLLGGQLHALHASTTSANLRSALGDAEGKHTPTSLHHAHQQRSRNWRHPRCPRAARNSILGGQLHAPHASMASARIRSARGDAEGTHKSQNCASRTPARRSPHGRHLRVAVYPGETAQKRNSRLRGQRIPLPFGGAAIREPLCIPASL